MDFLAAVEPDTSIPYKVGQYIWLIIGVLVIARQWPKLKEEGRSKLATLGLMLFWLGAGSLSVIRSFIDSPSPEIRVAAFLGGLICLALAVAAAILGIIGLAQTFGPREKRLGGRGAAIWALCLSALIISLAAIGFFQGLQTRLAQEREIIAKPGERSSTFDQAKQSLLVENPEYNFRMKLPGTGWIELDTAKINTEITFMASNQRLRANAMIIAEPIGNVEFDLAPVEELIRSRALAAQAGAHATDFHDGVIGGRELRRMEMETVRAAQPMELQFTLFVENGVVYQVITTHAGEGGRDRDKEVTEYILASFETIDPDFAYTLDSSSRDEWVTSSLGGVKVPLTETGWQVWDMIAFDAQHADDGALYKLNAGLQVMATQEFAPGESEGAIHDMFLKAIGIDLEHVRRVSKNATAIDGHPAIEYLIEDQREGGFYWFRIRIAKTEKVAIALAAWWAGNDEPPALLAALNRASFHPESAIEPERYEEEQRRLTQAKLTNDLGLYAYTIARYAEAFNYFQRAHALRPDYLIYQQNVLRAACQGDYVDKGLTYAQNQLEWVESDHTSRALYATLLIMDRRADEGVLQMAKAIEGGFDDADDLLTIVNLLIDQDRHQQAAEVLRASIAQRGSEKYTVWLASVLRLAGKAEEAEAVLQPYVKEAHMSLLVADELVDIKIAQGLPSEALAIASQALEENPDSPEAVEFKLDALVELNWLAQAQTTVATALEQFPENAMLTDYQQWLTSQVGRDDLSLVSAELVPVPMPAALADITEKATAVEVPEAWAEREVVYDYRITGYQFEPGKPVRKTIRKRARINTRGAVEYFSTLDFDFDRDRERVYINHIKVFDEAGELVASANRNLFYLSEQSNSEMASDETTLYAPVNGLAPGCTLVWEVTWEDTFTSDEFPFTRCYLASNYPMLEGGVFVTGAVDTVQSIPLRVEALADASEDVIAWRLANAPGTDFESNMPDFRNILPLVELGSTKQSWEELARDYLKDIATQLEPDEMMASVVSELDLAGLSEREKVLRLVRMAQDRIVYKALEFGATARIPDAASETWMNRYGDCKDLTVVIFQLLKAASIESHPLLVNTANPLVEELPSLDQFNHMVIYVPSLLEQPVIDLVDTEFDPTYGPPLGLGGRRGLLCDSDDPRLIQIVDYPTPWEQSTAVVECKVAPGKAPGVIEITENLKVIGYYGSRLRRTYRSLEPKDYQAKIENSLRDYLPPQASVKSVEITNLRNPSEPMTVHVDYTVEMTSDAFDYLPAWKGYYLDLQPDSGRTQPYRFSYPFSVESIVRFDPQSMELDESKEDRLVASGMVRFDRSVTNAQPANDNTQAWQKSYSHIGWPASDLSVDEYYAFFANLDRSREAATRRFTMKRKTASGALSKEE